MSSRPDQAVLFDLDGVLVDTEAMITDLWAEIFGGHGLALTPQEITRLTAGQRFEGVLHALEAQRGWKAPEDFLPMLDERFNAAFGQVPLIEGAAETLAALQAAGIPFAVASNSQRNRLFMKLDGAGLSGWFGPHVYDVSFTGGRGKPAPDLYLVAARGLGVSPAGCVVVEDSLPGATAGLAAGARVYGLLSGSHHLPDDEAKLLGLGVERVLHSHAELRAALGLGPEPASQT